MESDAEEDPEKDPEVQKNPLLDRSGKELVVKGKRKRKEIAGFEPIVSKSWWSKTDKKKK